MGEFLISTILPWLLSALLGVVLFFVFFYLKDLFGAFLKMPNIVKICLVLVVVVGAFVRFSFVPNQQRILFDEDRYLSYAVTFAKFGKAVAIDVATQEKHILGKPDQAVRSTVPVVNSWVLRATNFSEDALYGFAKSVSVLQIILFFILAQLIFGKYRVSLFAGIGMALMPTVVYWSTSSGLDSYFVFFAILAMVSAVNYAKRTNWPSLLFFCTSVFLLLCVRVEALALLPIIICTIFALRLQAGQKKFSDFDRKLIMVFGPFLLLRIFISLSVIGQKWCCAESLPLEAFSLTYTFRNLTLNVISLFAEAEIPFLVTVFAMIAAVIAFGKRDFRVHIFTAWFVLFFAIYSSYYAGRFFSYEFSGSYGRFFLMLVPPLLILASLSADEFAGKITRSKKSEKIYLVLVAVFCMGIIAFTFRNYKKMVAVSPYFSIVENIPFETRKFLKDEMLPAIPVDAVVLHNLTAIVLMSGRTSVFFGSFVEDTSVIDFVVGELKAGREVYSVEAPQCVVFPKRCDKFSSIVKFVPVSLERKNPHDFEFAKLELN